jgi:hypothetical protein
MNAEDSTRRPPEPGPRPPVRKRRPSITELDTRERVALSLVLRPDRSEPPIAR